MSVLSGRVCPTFVIFATFVIFKMAADFMNSTLVRQSAPEAAEILSILKNPRNP